MLKYVFVVMTLLIAGLPFLEKEPTQQIVSESFPGWPAELQGVRLVQHSMDEQEALFLKGFPGKVARFTDGRNEILFRWIERGTRKLHPAADCLRASGYEVKPHPVRFDAEGRYWGCVKATHLGSTQLVCEVIYDEFGNSWSDVSSWYWATILKKTTGPWWSVVVAAPYMQNA